jgi:ribosomal protein L16 Arg81 hydroxylase
VPIDFVIELSWFQVDVLAADLEGQMARYPDFAQAKGRGLETVLEAGDAVFIPKRWWHACQSLSGSISVNFWWV